VFLVPFNSVPFFFIRISPFFHPPPPLKKLIHVSDFDPLKGGRGVINQAGLFDF